MSNQRHEFRERDQPDEPEPTPDRQAVPKAGRHEGEHRTEGVEQVLQSGDRGADWAGDSEQSQLDDWGFSRGGGE